MIMKRAALLAALLASGCSGGSGSGQDGGLADASDGGTAIQQFAVTTLDPEAQGSYPISLAVHGDTIGVSYWVDSQLPDGGPITELRYVERGGEPEKVTTVTYLHVYGSSLAYDSKGEPHIAYVGPPSNGEEGNEAMFWFEASCDVASRSGGAWPGPGSVDTAMHKQYETLGLWPALAIDERDNYYLAGKDINYGQFQVQGGQHASIDFVMGVPHAWGPIVTAVDGSNSQAGYGARNSIVLADGLPALSWSGQDASAGDTPVDVWFTMQKADGTWPALPIKVRTVSNTVNGPSMAWKKGAGFIIAYQDENAGQTSVIESPDGLDWTEETATAIFGTGTGGWYPSAAFTPDGNPAVAYYLCSIRSGAGLPCPEPEDEIQLKWRVGDRWQQAITVDSDGGHYIKLAYWNDRAVVAYKDVHDHALKLAIQNR